jgi:hypothetical protein
MILNHALRLNFNPRFGRSTVGDGTRNPAQELSAVPPCNDNQRALFTASFRRTRRPVLFCRWRTAPGGALECVWYTDLEQASAGEEPLICRLGESLRRPLTNDVARKLHCTGNRTERLDSLRGSFFNSNRSGVPVCLTGKKESGATLTWSLVRSCPRNCQRRAILPNAPLGFAEQSLEGGKW